ncbi:hypothetical protein GGR50DRAFT_691941 [Xylaria sp. CBS 124048]|nr:hypothetical protein GGR50DRAFT_691941 [Xylaria sp. CBS 124048]
MLSHKYTTDIVRMPPTAAKQPRPGSRAEADAHNASILKIRGLFTSAKGDELSLLAEAALENDEMAALTLGEPVSAGGNQIYFEPFFFFFYGTLLKPDVLTFVCDGPDEDHRRAIVYHDNASIKGWKTTFWGPYLALEPVGKYGGANNVVNGKLWWCDQPEYVARLCRYETAAYRMAYCDVFVPSSDGSGVDVLKNVRTFVFNECDE